MPSLRSVLKSATSVAMRSRHTPPWAFHLVASLDSFTQWLPGFVSPILCTYVHHNSPPASPSPLPRQGQRSGHAPSASSPASVINSRHPGGRMWLLDAHG